MCLSATDLHLSQSLKYAGSLMRQDCTVRGVQVFLSVHSMDSYVYLAASDTGLVPDIEDTWYPGRSLGTVDEASGRRFVKKSHYLN
jgi:hypothetical protein